MNWRKNDEVILKYWTYDVRMSRDSNDLRFIYVGCVGEVAAVENEGSIIVKFEGRHSLKFAETSMLRKIV